MKEWPIITYKLSSVHGVTTNAGPDFATDSAGSANQLRDRLEIKNMAWVNQVHGGKVVVADGNGCLGEADALITDKAGQGVLVRGADCPLLLIESQKVVAAVHASWRSTVRGITKRTVDLMISKFGANPADMKCVIAPSAGVCCYEVGNEVVNSFGENDKQFFINRDGKLFFDLWKANADQLCKSGVLEDNIIVSNVCTICCDGTYPSYRRDGIKAGRFAAGIGVRK